MSEFKIGNQVETTHNIDCDGELGLYITDIKKDRSWGYTIELNGAIWVRPEHISHVGSIQKPTIFKLKKLQTILTHKLHKVENLISELNSAKVGNVYSNTIGLFLVINVFKSQARAIYMDGSILHIVIHELQENIQQGTVKLEDMTKYEFIDLLGN